MTYDLNEHEERLIEFLEERMQDLSGIPSYEEMRVALDLSSKDHVSRLLDGLEAKGFVQRRRGQSRSLTLLRTGTGRPFYLGRTIRVPLLAIAPASFDQATLDGFEPDSYIELTRDLVPDERGIYALHVRGDSMVDALINDGDIVVLRQQEEARDGDLVQAWICSEESATLKRFFRQGGRVCLRPENPTHTPRFFPADDVRIQGKVILVIRQLERQLAA